MPPTEMHQFMVQGRNHMERALWDTMQPACPPWISRAVRFTTEPLEYVTIKITNPKKKGVKKHSKKVADNVEGFHMLKTTIKTSFAEVSKSQGLYTMPSADAETVNSEGVLNKVRLGLSALSNRSVASTYN